MPNKFGGMGFIRLRVGLRAIMNIVMKV